MTVRIAHAKTEEERTRHLASQVRRILRAGDDGRLHHFTVTTSESHVESKGSNPDAADLLVNLHGDSKAPDVSATLQPVAAILDVRHNPKRSADVAKLPQFLADEIVKVFESEMMSIAYLLNDSPFAGNVSNVDIPADLRRSLDARATRTFKSGSSYHLAFSLFSASSSPSTWDIETALEQNVKPLLHRLSHISDFSVNSQVQLYASFSPSISGPHFDETTSEWKLNRNDLGCFVNAAEWPLSPSIGAGPTINFVLYVPPDPLTPLILADTGGTSWLIPQWGGVQILNPQTHQQRQKLTANDLNPIMTTFANQLTALLGLPTTPTSLGLRIDGLARHRTTTLILSASSTLGALARLTLKLPSISIPTAVSLSVSASLAHLDHARRDLLAGHHQSALEHARIAEAEAEAAFFHPSMVGQVYFPDEHKVAVYVPLLGPMAVPLIMAVLKELKSIRAGGKAKTA